MDSTTADRVVAEYAKKLALMANLPNLNTPTSNVLLKNPDSQTTTPFNRRFRGSKRESEKHLNISRSDSAFKKQESFFQRSNGTALNLDGVYKGSSLFLVLSGPSLSETPLHLLSRRGIVTMGVNNSWLMWKPDLWVCVDTPGRFADVGWLDPRILKMCPLAHHSSPIREMENGVLKTTETLVKDCPNVAHFVRQDYFDTDTFWNCPYAQWGCLRDSNDCLGITGARSVMLVALKVAYSLGFKRIFLVGADFKMSEDSDVSPYAWKENKSDTGRRANNRLYKALNARFDSLVKAGMPLEIYNCTKDSGLKSFKYVEFETAVLDCVSTCEKEVETKGWYVK